MVGARIMTVQQFVILTVVFTAGMFVGSNLGVIIMCLLIASKPTASDSVNDDTVKP